MRVSRRTPKPRSPGRGSEFKLQLAVLEGRSNLKLEL
jgi:hypothetical protein